ncbi:MAG TPA: MFS transporter [Terriglobia bacterium]|nr:MFS transporter [Terriglobia bacterium]
MRQFSRNFWVYLLSGFFWSLGLMTFFLVYNLHLLEFGFNEAVIGKIASALTLGSLAVTLLTGRLLTRYGENRVIQSCVLATAILLPLRSATHAVWWLIVAAFLNGASIGGWMVSAPPFLARNTDPERRTWAFSLSYGSSIATGALAGLIVGFVSRDLSIWAWVRQFTGFSAKQCVLLASAASVLLGFFVLLFLRQRGTLSANAVQTNIPFVNSAAMTTSRRFILQLLMVLVLWSFFVGSFPPFFNVYFHKQFNQSLDGIGIIFSVSQLCQLSAVLCMPWLALRLGRIRAISSVQFASALVLPALIVISNVQLAGLVYLAYLSFQVMAEPALESFIMDSVLPEERNKVASLRYMALFSVQALAVLVSGFAITHFGYSFLLVAMALLGIAASLAFYFFFQLRIELSATKESNVPATCPLH